MLLMNGPVYKKRNAVILIASRTHVRKSIVHNIDELKPS